MDIKEAAKTIIHLARDCSAPGEIIYRVLENFGMAGADINAAFDMARMELSA